LLGCRQLSATAIVDHVMVIVQEAPDDLNIIVMVSSNRSKIAIECINFQSAL